MRKVFISYAREDRDAAHALADQLKAKGYDVWWDWNLVGGSNFRQSIRENLHTADKVIVLWSSDSIASSFVIDEAGLARDGGKLIPLLIEDVEPPLGFGGLHCVDTRDFAKDIDAIIAALEGEAIPAGKPSKAWVGKRSGGGSLGTIAVVAAAIIAAVAAGSYLTLNQVRAPGESPSEAAKAAQRDYDLVQSIYSNVKNKNIACNGVKDLIDRLRHFQGNQRLVPKDAVYSVFKVGKKENPTIGDLAIDRMTRIRDVRRECF